MFVNEDEAAGISGLNIDSTGSTAQTLAMAEEAARRFVAQGVGLAVITLGPAGALAVDAAGQLYRDYGILVSASSATDATGADPGLD